MVDDPKSFEGIVMAEFQWTSALIAASALTLMSACGGGADTAPSSEPITQADSDDSVVKLETPPVGQLPEGVTPIAYTIDLVLDPEEDGFEGTVYIDVELDRPHARIWLHALGPVVKEVFATTSDGARVEALFTGDQAEGGVSKIDFAEPLPAGAHKLTISYDAPYNRNLAGLYRADQAGQAYLASQMEAIDARRMVPSFDEPRFKTPFTVAIAAPKGNKVITNGALKAENSASETLNALYLFETTRPLPTYLLGFIIGPYDERVGEDIPANNVRAEPIPFRGFAPAGKGDKLKEAMDATPAMLDYQERYFGVPYPYGKLDIAAVPDFAFGAMENAGIIIYRESALLIDERTSLTRKRGVLTVHAHELAHQWFGNLVTPKWWDDIWLNEAFATWFAYKTMHDFDPDGGFDRTATRRALGAMETDSLKSARQIRNPVTKNSAIMDAFDGITYSKGGGVLSMFENYLGEDGFREGVRLHMQRFPDGVADVNDFMTSLADGSGDDTVVEAFSSFIFQPGIPYLDVQLSCPAIDAGLITVTQSRYAPLGSDIATEQLWKVPLALRVSSPNGDVIIRDVLKERSLEIPLDGGCADWVMPNADGKGYWRFATSPENWKGLTDNYASLSPGEQLVFADSLAAGFKAGDVSAETMLAGLRVTATGEWDAASQGIGEISSFALLLSEDRRDAFRTYVAETYGPAWEFYRERSAVQLSQGERLLREDLYDAMVMGAQDESMRAELQARAYDYVGVGGDPDEDALQPSELYSAISVAAQTGGTEFLKAALNKAYTSSNQNERSNIFSALAGNLPAEDVAVLLKEANGSEFTGREMYSTFQNALLNERAREQNWTLFQQSWQNLVARTPAVRKARLASATGAFCDEIAAEAAADFFRERASEIPGYERSLAQGLEKSKLCAALKGAKAEELAAALEGEE